MGSPLVPFALVAECGVGFAVFRVDPTVLGVGPAFAIPAVVKSAGLELCDIALFEINEAFASQFVYSCKKLGLDHNKVNVNDDAIALGNPLGATGGCCVVTLLDEMKYYGNRFGVISMCTASQLLLNATEILKQKLDVVRLSKDIVEVDDQFGELGAHMRGG
ncbi:3-ketoacyl-CoA thiolase 5, peroxisomal-like [Arachis hypogaea]|uniref:3-ketoacyl-CoA thiolase 5, peroxisomal-like n=1 Tax=Arachis hypogaea TaxID=3818 RepID=UPI000DECBB46|nr:3-ketoacyl-CoA thiolase 5, peroxisomal-like [Arachis hypogaea]